MNSPAPGAAPQRVAAPRGRRAGKPDTPAQILAVAQERFLRDGYPNVTLRTIAAEAGCDVALISYHFGSKRGLFGAALQLIVNPADILQEVLKGDLQTFAPRALRALVTTWDSPEGGGRLRALLRDAASDPALGDVVRGGLQAEMIDKIAGRLGGADARVRAGMFSSQVTGVIFSRYVIRVEPIASMTVDELVRALSPALTVTLRGPLRRRG
ncbi:TetR family transcriptional regulator [uncultured Jatrophihabitans sp.]|uniref:TetR/AcrR family transcriptional regulator n=1 Tax=uncultured Jatrophihabitans sp. TaxID=1610747 RepID=UPI0035CB5231